MKLLLATVFTTLFAISGYAQTSSGVSSDGRDFYVGMVPPSFNTVAAPDVLAFFGAYMLISSYADNTVNISYFDKKTGKESAPQIYHISARTGIQVLLDSAATAMYPKGDSAEYASCHVTALSPINIQYFSTGACAGGSYLALATPALGRKYVIASYNDNPGDLSFPASPNQISEGFFLIVAAFDSTAVTILSNSTTMGGHPGYHSGTTPTFPNKVPYTVMLHRGQCYLVKSAGKDISDDISGSIVESNKPIAVLGGQENAALGGVSNRSLEGRDYMVEQMIPSDFWDTTGYLAVPLKDSQPANASVYEGVGENYRTYSDSFTCINLTLGSVSGPTDMTTGALVQPPPERFGVDEPVDFESCNGKKFGVMMYDLRNFANSAPYPAPSMMTIIPMSRWKTSYLWYVPANKFEILQAYYCDVIASTADLNAVQNGIVGSFNGGSIRPIKQILSQEQQWKGTIPNHPELTGVRFKLNPGCFYASGPHPFIVYNFGFRAIDPEFDLGDFDADDFFFSYANPTGALLSSGDTANFKVTIDSQCGKWNLCAFDQRKNNPGIRSVSLLNEQGISTQVPPQISVNCHLDTVFDPTQFGEIEFDGTTNSACFSIIVTNPSQPAYAAVMVTDNAGNEQLVPLTYTPVSLSLPTNISITNARFGVDTCLYMKIINTGKTSQLIESITLTGNPAFKLDSVPPVGQLTTGDSESLKICFLTSDTVTLTATINLSVACLKIPVQLSGRAGTGLIFAHDINFGRFFKGTTPCHHLGIDNIGQQPFTLSKKFTITGSNNFTIDTSNLPFVITPGHAAVPYVCYSPKQLGNDTAIIHWNTDIDAQYSQSVKNYSILIGESLPNVAWDRDAISETVICEDSLIQRIFLLSDCQPGDSTLHISSVTFSGPNASEWKILNNELGLSPLSNFDFHPCDSFWVDIVFKPDLIPQNYADRHAQLIANVMTESPQIIDLTGHVLHAEPDVDPDTLDYKDIAIGMQIGNSFRLKDTGTAPLIIQSIVGITYPILNLHGIAPGDTIQPGQSGVLVSVDVSLTSLIDTEVILTINFATPCAKPENIVIRIHPTSGVESTQQQSPILSIRPNPANGNSIILSFDGSEGENAEVRIFDVLGREMYSKNIFGENSLQIPIRNLQNGMYYAKVMIGGNIFTEKFEVAR